jgi:hypothetical protein
MSRVENKIMTMQAFQTLSDKWFSLRNGTIEKIDKYLDAYHKGVSGRWPQRVDVNPAEDVGSEVEALTALRKIVDEFVREKAWKYRDGGTQSQKRKKAVAKLRGQVYDRIWELRNLTRQDLEVFTSVRFGAEETRVGRLVNGLRNLRTQVKATGDTANSLRSNLHQHVEAWFMNEGKAHCLQAHAKYAARPPQTETADELAMRRAWKYYFANPSDRATIAPSDIIRLGTMDLDDLINKKGVFLKYADMSRSSTTEKNALGKMALSGDSLISTFSSNHPPVEIFPKWLRVELEAYLWELITVEMADEMALVQEALQGEADYYRAVVQVDYYAFRTLKNIGLHKDTVGNTLFVALHYINEEQMQGPEYVDDPAPMRPKDGHGFYNDRVYLTTVGDEQRRGAPWAKVADVSDRPKYVWPDDLLRALQAVRKPPDEADYLDTATLPPNGLITFVDELVFHATPSPMLRKDVSDLEPDATAERQRHINSGVSIPGTGDPAASPPHLNVFGERTFQRRIRRRLSEALARGETLPSSTGSSDPTSKRKFWRVWLSVVPKHWYEELPIRD